MFSLSEEMEKIDALVGVGVPSLLILYVKRLEGLMKGGKKSRSIIYRVQMILYPNRRIGYDNGRDASCDRGFGLIRRELFVQDSRSVRLERCTMV
jgi:hypothetical protein